MLRERTDAEKVFDDCASIARERGFQLLELRLCGRPDRSATFSEYRVCDRSDLERLPSPRAIDAFLG